MKINGISNYPSLSQVPNKERSGMTNSIGFGEDKKNSLEPEEKKSGFSFKKATNLASVILGAGIIGGSAIYMKRRPQWMKIQQKGMENLERKIKFQKTRLNDLIEMAQGKQERGGWLYRVGNKVNSFKEKIGDELTNNLLYGFGTVCIMPLVIMFSPFGKKDSTKEDKLFAVLRQPLSFATMFSIQLTVDKLFSRWNKNIVSQNLLENENVRKALNNSKNKLDDNVKPLLDQIQYNEKPLWENFENLFTEKLGDFVNKEEITKQLDVIKKIKSADVKHDTLMDFLKDKKVDKQIQKVLEKALTQHSNVAGKGKCVTEAIKIASNVIISQIIGCTLLNVIYGKTMKGYENHKENKAEHNQLRQDVDKLMESQKDGKEVA